MKKEEYLEFVMVDLLSGIENISSRAMFGGYGIYKAGTIFAIIAENVLYFKVGDRNRSAYEERGSSPFVYSQGKHKATYMPYWEVPADILEDRELLKEWVQEAYLVTLEQKK